MRPADLFLYLVGHRGAIERIAASRGAIWIGALLVVTAGVARNYDHLDFLRNPEWVLAPFGVSLVSAAVVFLCVNSRLDLYWAHGRKHHFRSFLALFWLTAPCAWLYAIPAERITDLLTATKFNVALLALVALWRVALVTRAVQVLTGGRLWAIVLAILVPAAAEAFLGSTLRGFSLVGIMGGIRLPPHHQFLQDATQVVSTSSFWIGALLFPFFCFLPRQWTRAPRGFQPPDQRTPGAVWLTTLVLVAGWFAVALPLQPAMQRRHHLQSLLDQQRPAEAIAFAAAQQADGFAPWHYLPPDPHARGFPYTALFAHMDGSEPEWLRRTWLEQSLESLRTLVRSGRATHYRRALEAYLEVPGGLDFLLSHEEELRSILEPNEWGDDLARRQTEFDEAFARLRNPDAEPPSEVRQP